MQKVSVQVRKPKNKGKNKKMISKDEFNAINIRPTFRSVFIPYVSIVDLIKRRIANPTTWLVDVFCFFALLWMKYSDGCINSIIRMLEIKKLNRVILPSQPPSHKKKKGTLEMARHYLDLE